VVVTALGADVVRAAVVTALGGNVIGMAILAIGDDVLDAVITAFTAAIFVSKMDAFLCHFFLWAHLPCPGPGMFAEIVFGDFVRQVLVDRD
jgi:hypothetical protein